MSDLMDRHLQLHRSIDRALSNFKKVGKKNWTPALIRTRIRYVEKQWERYEESHQTLCRELKEKEDLLKQYIDEDQYGETEEVYLNTISEMTSALEELEPVVSQPCSSPSAHSTFASAVAPPVQLPRINLSTFDGKYEDWEAFRDQFRALILENASLHDVTRMHYLVSSLKGAALEGIRHLSITASNLQTAWANLNDRYENKQRLIGTHISSIVNTPTLTKESASGLQALCDALEFAHASLTKLGRTPENIVDDIFVFIAVQKLDPVTRKAWSIENNLTTAVPTRADFTKFVLSRARALEDCANGSTVKSSVAKPTASTANSARVHIASQSKASQSSQHECPLCNTRHYLNVCPKFKAQNPRQRADTVKRLSRCFNCLSHTHSVSDCSSKYSCRLCRKRHHSLLHVESHPGQPTAYPSSATSASEIQESSPSNASEYCENNNETIAIKSHFASTKSSPRSSVLLATAWVQVRTLQGRGALIRALLDQGSEATFITEALALSLRANRTRVATSISAVGGVHAGNVRHTTRLRVSSRTTLTPTVAVTALVLDSLSTYKPNRVVNSESLSHLHALSWADPNPSGHEPIQMIIGADVYSEIILDGVRKGNPGQPIAQNSIFGWVISGPLTTETSNEFSSNSARTASSFHTHVMMHHGLLTDPLSDELRRFWEVEDLPSANILTPDEEQCETHFQANTSRTAGGRYIVRLPFRKGPPIEIGESRPKATKMLQALTRKLNSDSSLGQEYNDFLREYENLGHMRRACQAPAPSNQFVYIPHHPVIREGSTTTHLRVVFNASCSTSDGSSLNDHLLPGPKLQLDLPSVILRWRLFRFVYTADIAKMYRQILVDSRDLNYQRILWKSQSSNELTEYQLLTVTYGMTCAPFLALRVLQRLVEDEGQQYPLATSVLKNTIYVDDVLFGSDDIASLRKIRDQLVELLKRGHFTLRKWASNSSDLLSDIDPADHGLGCSKMLTDTDQVKILGIGWNPALDAFQLNVKITESVPDTKRKILSTIAKLYDPLGWVTPSIISAKVLIQDLWRLRIGWDDPVPDKILSKWKAIYASFANLDGLQIPRWSGYTRNCENVEIHGFADASTVAYSAVIYLKSSNPCENTTVSLLTGKSRVAPLAQLTIPRLELQAAVLLSRLLEFVLSSLSFKGIRCFCWTDSTVVLAWLRQHPSTWKTFVANRVADIHRRLPQAEWRHVPTAENPADCASRGLLGQDLRASTLWWQGPEWMSHDQSEWPNPIDPKVTETSLEEKVISLHTGGQLPSDSLDSRFSSWPKLIRVTSYIRRFIASSRRAGPKYSARSLTAFECTQSKSFWIQRIQQTMFPTEIRSLSRKETLSTKSPIVSFNPFLDEEGILRVGGRLLHAPKPFREKHPILLGAHPLVRLLIYHSHIRAMHGGVQLTLSLIRQEYWILRARSLVKSVIHSCLTCVRENARVPNQIMGNLPAARVSPSKKCFAHCGLDYAGPFKVRASAGRGITARKSYLALFVCLATRAVHLEVVSDYSTPAFLNAYLRFCARRGLPEAMYSDNGTTFVGADKELRSAYKSALHDPNFQNKTASDGVAWHFIPPSAPHFGGIWEAGVRSVKHHLSRLLRGHTPTYEEFSTLLCGIEACLNSRPIAPLSDSFDNYEALTPGHFLMGQAPTTSPQPSVLQLNENRLSRWQLVQHMFERFWKLWSCDYINTLQQRSKWKRVQPSIEIGRLVLLRNPNLPPCKWELGRVAQLHPGDDGHVRVVTVKTATSEYKRPIVKLCILPVESESAKP